MNRAALVKLLLDRDPLAAAPGSAASDEVTVTRADAAGAGWFVDETHEGSLDEHRAAHRAGRPSVAVVRYGEGVDPQHVADRLLALAALARETGLLRVVSPVPVDGVRTPGSWGVEDLTVIAAARRVLDRSVRVRPCWERLGPQMCAVTLAFGADDLLVPADDPTDPEALAASAGRRAVTP